MKYGLCIKYFFLFKIFLVKIFDLEKLRGCCFVIFRIIMCFDNLIYYIYFVYYVVLLL